MNAPTEAEIRQALSAAWEADGDGHGVYGALDEATAVAALPTWWQGSSVDLAKPEPATGAAIWDDLRPSEAKRLHRLLGEASERAEEKCRKLLLEELTAAAVRFAEEFPDAPRAKKEAAA